MSPVEAREREEGRAEQVPLEGQPFPHELRELPRLESEEDQPEERRAEEPEAGLAPVVPLDGRQREHHEQARHQEVEGRDRRQRDVEDLVGFGADHALPPVGEVRRDQGAEEEALGAEKHPHRDLPMVEAEAADLVRVRGGPVVLEREAEDADDGDERAHQHDRDMRERADRADRHAEPDHDRPVGRGREWVR